MAAPKLTVGGLFLLVVLAATGIDAKPPSRLFAGTLAEIDEFPATVALLVWNQVVCGGVIINPRYVLTSAHCMIEDQDNINMVRDLRVLTGTNHYFRGNGSIYTIVSYKKHPDYAPGYITQWNHDLAILTLSVPIEFDVHRQPLKLPTADTPPGETCMMSGWGATYPGDEAWDNGTELTRSELLRKLPMKVISHHDCNIALNGLITPTHLCTEPTYAEGVASGDSGGPLQNSKGEVVGLASSKEHLRNAYPSVFARIFPYVEWIRENTRKI